MKKLIANVTICSVLASQAFAMDSYVVKSGDTLSQIVKQNYPFGKMYGSQGRIAQVLAKNPHIKNPNRIYPGQRIEIKNPVQVAQNKKVPVVSEILQEQTPETVKEEKPEVIIPDKQTNRQISEVMGIDEWSISALYGAKYLSISQTGAMGKAEIGVMFLNDLKLNSEFRINDWSFGFQFDSYKLKYETLTAGDSKQMYALNLFGSYKWILGGVNVEQTPLFRNDSSNIQMTKMTQIHLSLGAKKDFVLATRKPSVLKLKGWVNYPFSSQSESADIKLDSVKGFGLRGQLELNRQIYAREEYSLHATWLTQIGHQKLTQNVEWDVSKGETKSTIVDAVTTIGILFKF
jgi:LysM repeat protein